MADNILPLCIYPWKPSKETMAGIRAGKALADAQRPEEARIKAMPRPAVPGSPAPVLAIGERPNFACDYALIQSGTPEGYAAAIEWAVYGKDDPRIATMEKWLSLTLGCDVVEIPCEEEIEQTVVFK